MFKNFKFLSRNVPFVERWSEFIVNSNKRLIVKGLKVELDHMSANPLNVHNF